MTSSAEAHDPARPFLGWRILGAAFLAQALGSAVTLSAFGVFVVPLSEHFGVTRGRLGSGVSVALLVMGALGPFVGRWLDRGHVRRMMVIGAAMSGLGLLALSRATALWQLGVLFCGVVSGGAALFGLAPSVALVANWFVRRRGLAIGIAVAGATLAGFAAPAMVAYLIEVVGWRGALVALGVTTLGLGVPIFAALVVPRPEAVGQRPDGDSPADGGGASERDPTLPVVADAELVRDPRLWLLAAGFGLLFTSPVVTTIVLVPFGEDLGFSRRDAAWFFSAMAPFSLLSKLVFGALVDRLPARAALWIVLLGNVAVWALLALDPSYPAYLAIGAFYGLAIGALGPLHGVIIGLCFGRVAFGRAMGIGSLVTVPLVAIAPVVAGGLYDASGGYHSTFVVQAVALLGAGLLLQLVRIPKPEDAAA